MTDNSTVDKDSSLQSTFLQSHNHTQFKSSLYTGLHSEQLIDTSKATNDMEGLQLHLMVLLCSIS